MAAHPVAVHAGARPPGSAAGQPGEAAAPPPVRQPRSPGGPRSFPPPPDLPEVIILAGGSLRPRSLSPASRAGAARVLREGAWPPPSAWRERGGAGLPGLSLGAPRIRVPARPRGRVPQEPPAEVPGGEPGSVRARAASVGNNFSYVYK